MKKGFTLVELMIVVAIMAILAAVSAPRFTNQIKKAKDARTLRMLGTLRSASRIYLSDQHEFAEQFDDLINIIIHNEQLEKSISFTSGSAITSYQMQAGTVKLNNGTASSGTVGDLTGEKNIVEIYYDNTDGGFYIDGTTGSGINFLDTKEKQWNSY